MALYNPSLTIALLFELVFYKLNSKSDDFISAFNLILLIKIKKLFLTHLKSFFPKQVSLEEAMDRLSLTKVDTLFIFLLDNYQFFCSNPNKENIWKNDLFSIYL